MRKGWKNSTIAWFVGFGFIGIALLVTGFRPLSSQATAGDSCSQHYHAAIGAVKASQAVVHDGNTSTYYKAHRYAVESLAHSAIYENCRKYGGQ